MERTFIILKADCLLRGMIGEVISRFEKKGLKIVAVKMMKLDDEILNKHYAHHAGKPFFKRLVEFMVLAPVVCLVLEGKGAVSVVRKMSGVTNSREAEPGTIRGDLSLSMQSNIIHASDSLETAKKEIKLYFKDGELFNYDLPIYKFQYANDELE
ncbi:nucleoside-diphosphate kinase [Candidatus Micrarchaeota archaeon]|nr:nucleoside-diphosphate kinase [Candidatus Micrarchaeota archaeon]